MATLRSRDDRYLFILVNDGWKRYDIYCKKAKESDFTLLTKGMDAKIDIIDVIDDYLYIITNHNARNSRIVRMNLADSRKELGELIPESGDVIQEAAIIGRYIVVRLSMTLPPH